MDDGIQFNDNFKLLDMVGIYFNYPTKNYLLNETLAEVRNITFALYENLPQFLCLYCNIFYNGLTLNVVNSIGLFLSIFFL